MIVLEEVLELVKELIIFEYKIGFYGVSLLGSVFVLRDEMLRMRLKKVMGFVGVWMVVEGGKWDFFYIMFV